MTRKILIVASGTGGHVIPALNIAEKFIDTNYKITWIGTKRGIEVGKSESFRKVVVNGLPLDMS